MVVLEVVIEMVVQVVQVVDQAVVLVLQQEHQGLLDQETLHQLVHLKEIMED